MYRPGRYRRQEDHSLNLMSNFVTVVPVMFILSRGFGWSLCSKTRYPESGFSLSYSVQFCTMVHRSSLLIFIHNHPVLAYIRCYINYSVEKCLFNYRRIHPPKIRYHRGNADSIRTDQDITRLLCNSMVHYSVSIYVLYFEPVEFDPLFLLTF